jgi:hypothetical protein
MRLSIMLRVSSYIYFSLQLSVRSSIINYSSAILFPKASFEESDISDLFWLYFTILEDPLFYFIKESTDWVFSSSRLQISFSY